MLPLLSFSFSAIGTYLKENVVLTVVLVVILVLIIALIIAMIVLKAKEAKLEAAQAEEQAEEEPVPEEEQPEEEPAAPVSEKEPVPEEEAAPQEEPEQAVPAQEPAEEPAKEPAAEQPAEAEPSAAKKPAKKTAKAAAPKAAAAAPAEKAEAEKIPANLRGKWVISPDEGGSYYFELRASNGEKMLRSGAYNSLAGAKGGIKTYKTNIANGNFKIVQTKSGAFIFQLLNARGTLLAYGANYRTRASCESAVESTKRFAETASVEVKKPEQEEK